MKHRIIQTGPFFEVQRWGSRNYDGYYCQEWYTVATFWSEEEARAYIEIVEGRI